ncbi:MAG: SIMPL domain-containing protein [Chitinophagales bacterium]|nr:SIMPL domain-containing protein [Chitinophagales bacterium]
MQVRLIAAIVLTLYSTCLHAQWNMKDGIITVKGVAEVSIVPDQIDLEITLHEYEVEEKKIKVGTRDEYEYDEKKIEIDSLEKQLYQIMAAHNIPKSNLSLSQDEYSWWYYRWYYRTQGRLTFKLRLDNNPELSKFIKALFIPGIESMRIVANHHKDAHQLRQQAKIEAMKAAKAKAELLLNSVGYKLGKLVSVNEEYDQYQNYYSGSGGDFTSNVYIRSNTSGEMDAMSTIKVRYSVTAQFRIK